MISFNTNHGNANCKGYNSYIVLVPIDRKTMQQWHIANTHLYIYIYVMAIRRHRYASRFNGAWDTSLMRKARNPNWQRTTIVRSRLNMYWSQRSARNQPGNQILRLRTRVWQRWSKIIIIMTTIIYLLIREHWTYIYATKAYTISHHIITFPSYHSIPSKVIIS